MNILSFDTAANRMFVNISIDGEIAASKIVDNTKNSYHTAFLIPVIIELLKKLDMTMQDMDGIGVNMGPGSFTGIRASATVARIMAQQLNIPVVGISSLQIYSNLNNTSKDALCLLDARKGMAYIAVYSQFGEEKIPPKAVYYAEALSIAQNMDYFIISDARMAEKLYQIGLKSLITDESQADMGVYLAEITYNLLSEGDAEKYNWKKFKPLYIQPPPISMPKS